MVSKISVFMVVFLLLSFASKTQAEVITVDKVTAAVQPVSGNAFELLFSFNLPQLPKSVNIDYAVLSFGVNVAAPLSANFLEILSSRQQRSGKECEL